MNIRQLISIQLFHVQISRSVCLGVSLVKPVPPQFFCCFFRLFSKPKRTYQTTQNHDTKGYTYANHCFISFSKALSRWYYGSFGGIPKVAECPVLNSTFFQRGCLKRCISRCGGTVARYAHQITSLQQKIPSSHVLGFSAQ
ncbi:hypothetical protein K469DRAFT_56269 [Zopfia rhizophila CBS 207.26]|uniref:Uncharacterized protein n=1 Tax=Zopfia rhizophila CBS 207.26 TaxID=1314779 RepID=A0A6A6D8E9_9PEZI|nr:hypothetical protein K469DRAFT_56269 [Zopfia rhizophila CBS 207.26]